MSISGVSHGKTGFGSVYSPADLHKENILMTLDAYDILVYQVKKALE